MHAPEPVVGRKEGTDPEQQALLADSVGLALLVVLDMLSPAERPAFVLHDMFAVPYDAIAPIARQLLARRPTGQVGVLGDHRSSLPPQRKPPPTK